MNNLNFNDKYVIPICGVGKNDCGSADEVCNIALRLVKPCPDEQSGTGSGSGSGDNIGTVPLFDLSSWNNGQFPELIEPFKTMLNLAAERWNKLLNYRSDAIEFFKNYYMDFNYDWNGCFMSDFTIINDPDSPFIAFCGPRAYASIKDQDAIYRASLAANVTYYPPYFMSSISPLNSPPESRMCFNSAAFGLEINVAYFDPSSQYNNTLWLNVMAHELGHAIGFGLFWHLGPFGQWDPYCWLDHTLYINTSKTKKSSRNYIGFPVEDDGGGGTAGAHWEALDRHETNLSPCGGQGLYVYGLAGQSCTSWTDPNPHLPVCDLMTGWITVNPITELTINLFKDFGYVPTGTADIPWYPSNTPTNIPPYNPPPPSVLWGQPTGLKANLLPTLCEDNGCCTLDGQFKLRCRCHQ